MNDLTHIDSKGAARMVDVTNKAVTERLARAEAIIYLSKKALDLVISGNHHKGDVFATARIAGIQAAKKTSDLIPLCHPLALSSVKVELEADQSLDQIRITSECKLSGQTGVEMEALTAVSVAALTVYDMCKAVDKGISIAHIRLLEKTGGKSGDWKAS